MLLCYLPPEAVSNHVNQHAVTVLHARRQHSHSIQAKAKVGELLPALRADSVSTAVSHENIQTLARALLHCMTSSDFTDRCTSKAAFCSSKIKRCKAAMLPAFPAEPRQCRPPSCGSECQCLHHCSGVLSRHSTSQKKEKRRHLPARLPQHPSCRVEDAWQRSCPTASVASM